MPSATTTSRRRIFSRRSIPAIARLAWLGREELATLVDRVDLALGVSDYNREELEELGFDETMVVPLLVDTARLTTPRRARRSDRLLRTDWRTSCSSAGSRRTRRSKTTSGWPSTSSATWTCTIVSSSSGETTPCRGTAGAIRGMVRRVPDAARAVLVHRDRCPNVELAAYYRNAHAYVSLSEHEGFCVPLVEAMAMDVPMLAYAAAAVPETLGGAGVMFAPKDLEVAAELLGQLVYDQDFRAAIIAGQRTRRLRLQS